MRTENNLHRLTIDIPSDLHKMVKVNAILNDMSVKDYIIKTLGNDLAKEKYTKKSSPNSITSKNKKSTQNNLKNINSKFNTKLNKASLNALKEIDQKKYKSFTSPNEAMDYLNKKFQKKHSV